MRSTRKHNDATVVSEGSLIYGANMADGDAVIYDKRDQIQQPLFDYLAIDNGLKVDDPILGPI